MCVCMMEYAGQGDWTVSVSIYISSRIYDYIWQFHVFAQHMHSKSSSWRRLRCLVSMLPLNCSCLLYTFLTWLLWVEGIIVSGSSLNYPPPPSPLLHCNFCIGWNFNFKVHWYSLNVRHLSHCHFQFSSATSFLMWIFLLNFYFLLSKYVW